MSLMDCNAVVPSSVVSDNTRMCKKKKGETKSYKVDSFTKSMSIAAGNIYLCVSLNRYMGQEYFRFLLALRV